MTEPKHKINNSSLARIAGNIACGLVTEITAVYGTQEALDHIADSSVQLAKLIADKIEKESV